jgi:hypothetical protein
MNLCARRLLALIAKTLCAVILPFYASSATAVTIDDFSVGPITVTRDGAAAASASQTGLDNAHVIGGARDIIVGENGNPGQSLTIDTSQRELQFDTPTGSGLGYFEVTYGSAASPLNADLTEDGSSFFRLDFATDGLHTGRYRLLVDSNGSFQQASQATITKTVLPSGRVIMRHAFSGFPSSVDFTDIDRIQLDFFRIPVGEIDLLTFATAPEPNSIALIAVGTSALLRRSRSPKR